MSQGALTIADGSGLAVLAAMNAAFARLATGASGTSRPADIATGEVWIETDNPGTGVWSVWRWDGASDALIGTLNSTTHAFTPAGALVASTFTTKGDLLKGGVSGVPARFGIGSAFYGLYTNSAADDLEWRRNGWEKIADDIVPSGVSSVDITSVPLNVKSLAVCFRLLPASSGVDLLLRMSSGGAFRTGGSDYSFAGWSFYGAGGSPNNGGFHSNGSSSILLISNATNNATSGTVGGTLLFNDIQQSAAWQAAQIDCVQGLAGGSAQNLRTLAVGHMIAGALDGVRLYFSSGNVGSGRVSVLGLRG